MTKSLLTIGFATLFGSTITGCDLDTRGLDIDPAQLTAQVQPAGGQTRAQALTFPSSDARGPIVYEMQLTSGSGASRSGSNTGGGSGGGGSAMAKLAYPSRRLAGAMPKSVE